MAVGKNSVRVAGVSFSSVPVVLSVTFSLESKSEPFRFEIEGDVVVATAIPYKTNIDLPAKTVNCLRSFKLADPEFASVLNVDVLLGAEYYGKCICNENCTFKDFDIRLTQFGWTVAGAQNQSNQLSSQFSGCVNFADTEQEINFNLERFWAMEELETDQGDGKIAGLPIEHTECVEHFEKNVRVGEDGKL